MPARTVAAKGAKSRSAQGKPRAATLELPFAAPSAATVSVSPSRPPQAAESSPPAPVPPAAKQTEALSVSELIGRVRAALDAGLGPVWIAGEISNFRVPPSGHFYFTLKDERAQIPIVMFRGANARLRFRPEDGMEVLVHGAPQVYEARGTLQIIADTLEPRGAGALQIALEQLRQKLAAEGLFAPERKRALPFLPRCVGIVTAPRGAAVRDMIVTLRRRMPGIEILVRPVRVQGAEAPADIVAALDDLARHGRAEVIIVGRGGGSSEDLAAFNDEGVARAIAAASVPVVSAVGHEVDWTIADLVADQRAATPTAAAALVAPDVRELRGEVEQLQRSLHEAARRLLQRRRERLQALARLVRDPRHVLQSLQQRVDDLGERAERAVRSRLRQERERLGAIAGRLDALSPLAVLDRGYALARRAESGAVVRDAADLRVGDGLRLTFARGEAGVRVESSSVEAVAVAASDSEGSDE